MTLAIAMVQMTFPGPQGQGKLDTSILELPI